VANTKITFNPATAGAGRILQILNFLENGQTLLPRELATFVHLCDSADPNNAANFTGAAAYYGYAGVDQAAQNAMAKASYDELSSLNSKINSDASVSSVMTAIKQAANKHR